MRELVNFVKRFRDFIAFTALIIISLSLISMGNVSRIGGFRTVVIGTIGWLQELFAWIPNPGALKSENRALRNLNFQQSSEVIKMRRALIENQKLREMIGFKTDNQEKVLSAEIIGKTSIELRNYLTINRGENDGVQQGMAVRTDAGLVGIVMGISDNFSLIETIMNRNIKISVVIQRTLINGILVWEGGDNFLLKYIPESYDVQAGDVLLTSNFSNKYPVDIPIGQVVNIENDETSLFLRIEVKLFANLATLQQVFVVLQVTDKERKKMIADMEERLKTLKGK